MPQNPLRKAPEAEPDEPILSDEAKKLAEKMDPEQLCHFIKILDGFIERGVSVKERLNGLSVEDLMAVREKIKTIIVDKLTILSGFGMGRQINIDQGDSADELAKILPFPIKPKPLKIHGQMAKIPKKQSRNILN